MYFNDHNPPQFHVRYEEDRARIGIQRLEVLDGWLPARVLGLVMEWANLHQDELMSNWKSLANSGTFARIAPLT